MSVVGLESTGGWRVSGATQDIQEGVVCLEFDGFVRPCSCTNNTRVSGGIFESPEYFCHPKSFNWRTPLQTQTVHLVTSFGVRVPEGVLAINSNVVVL